MRTLKPYPAYQGSGVEWLGEVPRHWECLPNRALFAEVIDKNHPEEQMLSVTIARGVMTQSDLLEDSSKKDSSNLDKTSYKLVFPGDLAYNKMRAWQGAVGVSDYRGIVSPAYIVMRPKRRQEPRYLYYLFRTPAFATEAERWSYGITSDQWSLRSEDFKQIYSLNPPLDEQRAIADFLDGMDARITRFIAARRKMIALLEEKKQAAINQAVTRGLDPEVPMKDSGVDWLGEIPAHWELLRLKDFLREVDERSVTGEEELLSVSHLTGVTPRSEKNITMFKAESYVGHKTCRPGDIVANTMWLWMGAIGTAHHRGIISPSYAVYRFKNARYIDSNFLDFLLRSRVYIDEYHRQSTGIRSSRLRLYPEQLLRFKVAVPARDEQRAILEHIQRETDRVDALISRHKDEIELMQEYRTRLISDVVTGKLDVRGVELPAVEEVIGEEIEACIDDVPEESDYELEGL